MRVREVSDSLTNPRESGDAMVLEIEDVIACGDALRSSTIRMVFPRLGRHYAHPH